jgi:hypothetical protein
MQLSTVAIKSKPKPRRSGRSGKSGAGRAGKGGGGGAAKVGKRSGAKGKGKEKATPVRLSHRLRGLEAS